MLYMKEMRAKVVAECTLKVIIPYYVCIYIQHITYVLLLVGLLTFVFRYYQKFMYICIVFTGERRHQPDFRAKGKQ